MKASTNLKKISTVILLILFCLSATAQLEFTQNQVTNTFIRGADLIAVDIDQDGDMDIIGVNSSINGEIVSYKKTFQITNIEKGTYILKLVSENNITHQRIISI